MKEGRRRPKDPGEQPALVIDGRRQPDRRQISARWLAGTFLTGLTSCTLMGIALFAALNGRQQLATPPSLMAEEDFTPLDGDGDSNGVKSERVVLTLPRQSFEDRRQFELSTEQKKGETTIIRTQPFEMVHMALAEERQGDFNYPKFNALDLFADGPKVAPNASGPQIYGGKVESEVSLRIVDFQSSKAPFDPADVISTEDAEKNVRQSGLGLTDIGGQLAVMRYIDPIQFGAFNSPFGFSDTPDVKIVQENVSVSPRAVDNEDIKKYGEDVIPVPKKQTILAALNSANYTGDDATKIAKALAKYYGSDTLNRGIIIRIGLQTTPDNPEHLVRASIYKGMQHQISVALDDKDQYVASKEPEMTPVLKAILEGGIPVPRIAHNKLPSLYDAIYRSALTYDLTKSMAKRIIRILATDFDMQSRVSPDDTLEVFYPLTKNKDAEDPNSREILYINANFGGVSHKYYRFRSTDGSVDYYNAQGKSSKQFLLRKPVPNGIFRSPFGERRHPILGYVRMHTGVDWAAPRGSPIVAAGDGVIIKAGPSGGYGNHTEIQHANGYVTSYSHQNGFAPGIKPGVHVKQGQIIGYIGSTGLSTGPHCHFEVIVNGTKVDPMRVRIPDNKALSGNDLISFRRDRDRIDALISGSSDTKVASASNR